MPQILSIRNAGVPGQTIREIRARLDGDVLTHHPDVVVLSAGTNDALNSQKLTALAEFAAVYAETCAAIQRQSRLVVCTILPCYAPYLAERHDPAAYGDVPPAERVAGVNATIRQIATAHGLPLADLHTVFHATGDIGESATSLLRNAANSGARDGVHPTAAGYRLIAALINQTLLSAGCTDAQRIICLGDSITYGAAVDGAGTCTGETYPAVLHRLLTRSLANAKTGYAS